MLRKAVMSGQVFRPRCELVAPDPDVEAEYDVEIPMSDGTTLTAIVFRSRAARAAGTPVPVVMCAHPYDNHHIAALPGGTPFGGPPQQYRVVPQTRPPRFSTFTGWEAPDPNFWVPSGYAVVNLNLPGYGGSGGGATVMSAQQAGALHEAIEWVGAQPWCTGAVGLNGISFLAISQFHVAAGRVHGAPPEALKCISPWEGLTDIYRDVISAGGIADRGFTAWWYALEVNAALTGPTEDFLALNDGAPTEWIDRHPMLDQYWTDKLPSLEKIDLPMLVCGSFSDHGLHTAGSFRAFERAASTEKWVYTHRDGKWSTYYSREVQELTRRFMDRYLKGDVDNGFGDEPPVRLEVRSSRDVVHEVRGESSWPLTGTRNTPLYLTGAGLTTAVEDGERSVAYRGRRGQTAFEHVFTEDTELSGYMSVRLWVQVAPGLDGRWPDDMGLFATVDKLDRSGRRVPFHGAVGNREDSVTHGLLRVSRRELDEAASTPDHPVLLGTSSRPLRRGEIVPVAIALYPSSTFFTAGEGLRLTLSATDPVRRTPFRKDVSFNSGMHVIHFGGQYDSHLLVPRIVGNR